MLLPFDPISQPNFDIICVLRGNKVHGRIRHSFVILCTFNKCTVSYLTWKITQGCFIQICKPVLAGDVLNSPCLNYVWTLFSPVQFLGTTICFFSALQAYHWVIPTTALHICDQRTEWRYIHVCSGSPISILMVWKPHCCSISVCPTLVRCGFSRLKTKLKKKKVSSFVFTVNICMAFSFICFNSLFFALFLCGLLSIIWLFFLIFKSWRDLASA